ncbi:MAG: cell division protein ZapE [Galactobacter sp.]|uniref:cell division protein ZapE n=1 Tax=Galactobacter sp. TaxID=2676125 RepID=UPI0025B93D74|nr:cell division protein ZapE [Galactobacter sp.]
MTPSLPAPAATRNPFDTVTEEALCAAADSAGHTLDPEQRAAVAALAAPHSRGAYLHGAVGRGKSWLADQVLKLVATPKRRLHIHSFLRELQRTMSTERLPLPEAVTHLVGEARFLLLDEFHVHDIADAIMLRRTLVTLLDSDVSVLMTSNYPPTRLLPDPTFHEAILPAVEAIQDQLDVIELGGDHDWRTSSTHSGGFASGSWTLMPDDACPASTVDVALSATRALRALAMQDGTLSVTWDELCVQPRSVNDYLTLARDFSAISLVGLPAPEEIEPEPFQRLAYLLDVLVDADLPLDVTAQVSREELAKAKNLPRDADRMLSRLSMLRQG